MRGLSNWTASPRAEPGLRGAMSALQATKVSPGSSRHSPNELANPSREVRAPVSGGNGLATQLIEDFDDAIDKQWLNALKL